MSRVYVWDVLTRKLVETLGGFNDIVNSVSFAPAGKFSSRELSKNFRDFLKHQAQYEARHKMEEESMPVTEEQVKEHPPVGELWTLTGTTFPQRTSMGLPHPLGGLSKTEGLIVALIHELLHLSGDFENDYNNYGKSATYTGWVKNRCLPNTKK